MRKPWLAAIAVGALAAVGAGLLLTYQPLATGSATGHDEDLLIGVEPMTTEGGGEFPVYEYRYKAATSYYTLFSVRNDGPLPVRILGLDSDKVHRLTPFIGPAELLLGSAPDDPDGVIDWKETTPLDESTIEPHSQLVLWVRWEIGPCADEAPSYAPGSGIGPPAWIPLRWSVLGISRTSNVDLGYQMMFQFPSGSAGIDCSVP